MDVLVATKEARQLGERGELILHRLYGVKRHSLQRLSGLPRRGQKLTDLAGAASDELYGRVRQCFSECETVALTSAIIAIDSWDRWAISMTTEPRSYRPDLFR